MTSVHNAVFEELESSSGMVSSTSANTTDLGHAISGRESGRRRSSQFPKLRRHTFSVKKAVDTPANYCTPSVNAPDSQFRRYSLPRSLDSKGADFTDDFDDESNEVILMTGWLYKTSRRKNSVKTRGHWHRHHRRFRLTEHSLDSLEYSQLFQKVCSYKYKYNYSFSRFFWLQTPAYDGV